jgi:hypothetical protein
VLCDFDRRPVSGDGCGLAGKKSVRLVRDTDADADILLFVYYHGCLHHQRAAVLFVSDDLQPEERHAIIQESKDELDLFQFGGAQPYSPNDLLLVPYWSLLESVIRQSL